MEGPANRRAFFLALDAVQVVTIPQFFQLFERLLLRRLARRTGKADDTFPSSAGCAPRWSRFEVGN